MVNRSAAEASARLRPSTTPKGTDPRVEPLLEQLQLTFEELGLNGYQARVLLALLQAGSATANELARMAGVPRTSAYPVLHELESKRLAARAPGQSGRWVSLGESEVLDLLHAEQRERFEALGARVTEARDLLTSIAAVPDDASFPYVHILHTAGQSRAAFDQKIGATREELLMFTRTPVAALGKEPSSVVMALLKRGVRCRVLYQASDIADPPDPRWLPPLDTYHRAGVDGRVVEQLPMKLAIFDREVALLALSDPVLAEIGFPTSLMVEHPGFADLQVRAFNDLWNTATPYRDFVEAVRPGTTDPPAKSRPARKRADDRRRAPKGT